ncbi:MAG TPA: TetR/AcrR family transcriptional regulator [Bacillota bacterium]
MNPGKSEEILSAAIRLFQEKGYHAASMQDLADAVGLQKGSLYHYITSKEDLLGQIVTRSLARYIEELQGIVESDRPARDRLREAVQAHIRIIAENLGMLTIFLRDSQAALAAEQKTAEEEGGKRYRLLFEQIIRDGVDSGDFRPLDTKMAALTIIGACNWTYRWFDPEGRLDHREISDLVWSFFYEGLKRG